MKKPTKPQLYAEVSRLKSELEQSREEVSRLKSELETSKAEVSRLKSVLGKVWMSRRSARFWLKGAREEVGGLITALLSKI